MQEGAYVVWLASWYPSEIHPLQGDFIQRHAMAASLYIPIELWTFIEDPEARVTSTVCTRVNRIGQLTETRVYWHPGNLGNHFLSRAIKAWRMQGLAKRLLRATYSKKPPPVLVHTHIIMNAGLAGHWFSHWLGIPHLLSEQWTAYLPEARPNFRDYNPLSKWLWQRVVRHATSITAVSVYLARHLKDLSKGKDVIRIPNVVDGQRFAIAAHPFQHTTFITISADAYQKNLAHVLAATLQLSKKVINFRLLIIEEKAEILAREVEELGLTKWVQVLAPMPQEQLAILMAQCHALILYSRYETFGCVVIEAMAAGLPVIAADIPVLREIVRDGENGYLVPGENPTALAQAMGSFCGPNSRPIDREGIRTSTLHQFSPDVVGNKFRLLYDHYLPNSHS